MPDRGETDHAMFDGTCALDAESVDDLFDATVEVPAILLVGALCCGCGGGVGGCCCRSASCG